MSDPVIRIAARGDGVTAAGKHIAFGVPGDTLADDGELVKGPDHQSPPCRHFPACGGCQLQHLTDAAYADYVTSRIVGGLAQHGLATTLRSPHLSPPRSRRRATLRAVRAGGRVLLGFNEGSSSRVIDLVECLVLEPRLFALVAPLRRLLAELVPDRAAADVHLALADQGVDVLLKGVTTDGYDAAVALTEFGEARGLARLSLDDGDGAEVRYEPVPATVTLSGVAVPLPPGAFLQATADGEAVLVAAVIEAVGPAQRPLDLFAGLGTFALALPGQVTAAEASRDSIFALKSAAAKAGRLLTAEHRDLYRRPYDVKELAAFDAAVLDPPRAGAKAQVKALAASGAPRIAYVSCNPATFARDTAVLVGGGYRLDWIQPVGQFRWSTHVELAAALSR